MHKTAPFKPYIILYIFAHRMASETLSNQTKDEIIVHWEATNMYLTTGSAKYYYVLAKEDMPSSLRELFVQYVVGNPRPLERDVKASWKANADFDRDLLAKLAHRANGGSAALDYPSKKARCYFHIHAETKPCTK
jgi:hypothetical protein